MVMRLLTAYILAVLAWLMASTAVGSLLSQFILLNKLEDGC